MLQLHMHILFDAHFMHAKQTGIGRYCSNIIGEFSRNPDIELLPYFPFFNYGLHRIIIGFPSMIHKFKPDILHINNFAPFYKNTPIVNTIHDLCFYYYPETFSYKSRIAFSFFFQHSLRQSDKIICVSGTVKKQLLHVYPTIPEEKVEIIYHGVDPAFFYQKNRIAVKKALEEKFNLVNEYFLIVGNIEKRKNIIPVIDAFLELIKHDNTIQLVFAGQNTMKDEFRKRYNTIRFPEQIRFLNFVKDEDLNILYNGALGMIFNSKCEGFGLPIIEAMRCKVPVICNDIAVFREISGNKAIFTKNSNDIYSVLQRLIKEFSLRKKYQEEGYDRSLFFSWEKSAQKTFHIYQQILLK